MPAGNRHLPVVEARRLPLHMYSVSRETSPQRVSRLLEADGSLLFIAQIQHERHNAGNGAKRSKDRQNCRSHMYIASLGKISRESCIHASIPLPRDDRQPSFTAHRLQRRKKLDLDGGLPLSFIIPLSVALSNRLAEQDETSARRFPRRADIFIYAYFTGLEDRNVTSW